jgi:PAS domain S-box-containing protein
MQPDVWPDRDGGELARVRRELELTRRQLELVQRVGRVGNWALGPGLDAPYWSDELYRILGIPGGATPGRHSFYQRVHPDDLPGLLAEVDRAAATGGELFAEVRLKPADRPRPAGDDAGLPVGAEADLEVGPEADLPVGPDADLRVVAIRGLVEVDADGRPRHAFGTVTEVTDLRRLEYELRLSRERFRMAFDQAPHAMAIVGARPDAVGTFLQVNRMATEFFGVDEGGMIGHATAEFLHPEDAARNGVLMRRLLAGDLEGLRGLDSRIRHPDGQERWGSLTTALARNSDGSPAYFISHLVDVTERRVVEAEANRIADRDRRIATVLQDNLLPYVPSRFGPLRIGARYQPAGGEATVGGDWHDVFALPGGRIGVVVGDVAGHGIESAVAMNRLRHVVRALATSGASPAGVLRRLNDLVHDTESDDDASLATMVHVQLDPGAGVMRSSSAGHLPMLTLSGPDAQGRRIALPVPAMGGPPVGAIPGQVYGEHTMALNPGGLLIGFTDGLIERRDRSLDDGLLGVLTRLGELPGAVTGDVESLADALLRITPPGPQEDDIALIVLALDVASPSWVAMPPDHVGASWAGR